MWLAAERVGVDASARTFGSSVCVRHVGRGVDACAGEERDRDDLVAADAEHRDPLPGVLTACGNRVGSKIAFVCCAGHIRKKSRTLCATWLCRGSARARRAKL